MRILLLANRVPFPLQDGYNLHNYHHARELSRQHELTLLALGEEPVPAEVRGYFQSVRMVLPRAVGNQSSLFLRALRSLSVHDVFDCDPAVLSALQALRPHEYDVVWSAGMHMLVYAARIASAPVLADVADDESAPARARLKRSRGPLEFAKNLRDWSRITRFERTFLRHAAVCSVVAEPDRAAIAALCPGLDVRVIQNGVDHEYFAPSRLSEEHGMLVFEGNMSFAPNVEAAVHFARRILPLVKREEPRARFCAVGRDPSEAVLACRGPDVEVTGMVDDVRPYLARAELFVCPLLSGTGIKNKILQAWAMGKAVVATPQSAGGLAARPGKNIVIAGSDEEFARGVVELLRDPARRAALGCAARATAVDAYSWKAKTAELELALVCAAEAHSERASA